ncbi:GIY-YIG nuclease family protein [Bacillus altitudinis]|uniref:GIY-YIG nuclease family protein n=1 Tax=Bacillus altitudinis TaxID=293387 RepID=UPI0016437888|nr:GIY-YIG nuclease family protein [Bacillus altitudinis]
MKIIKDAITDSKLTNRHFYYLHMVANHFKNEHITIKKRLKTFEDLETMNYIAIDFFCGYYHAELRKSHEYFEIDKSTWDKLNNEDLIMQFTSCYRKSKEFFLDITWDTTSLRDTKAKLIRLYSFLKESDRKGIADFSTKEIIANLRLLSFNDLECLTHVLKKMGLFKNSSSLLCELNRENEKNNYSKLKQSKKKKIKYEVTTKINEIQHIYTFEYSVNVENASDIPKGICGVYAYTNNKDEVLYIGKSKDLKSRTYTHLNGLTNTAKVHKEFKHISILTMDREKYISLSDKIEQDLIKNLCPKYNKVHNKSA